MKVRPHPYGDRIWLADVEIGPGHHLQIVWGGVPLLDEGDLVPVAPPGSRLPQGKMRRRRYRGEVSEGMLCSLAELGWDLSVSDRVALLDERSGLTPGESLDSRDSDWPSITRRSSGGITGVPGIQLIWTAGVRRLRDHQSAGLAVPSGAGAGSSSAAARRRRGGGEGCAGQAVNSWP